MSPTKTLVNFKARLRLAQLIVDRRGRVAPLRNYLHSLSPRPVVGIALLRSLQAIDRDLQGCSQTEPVLLPKS